MKTIFATVHVKPADEDNFIKAATRLVSGTRSEPGNEQFNLYHGIDCPSDFIFTEVYKNESAIENHRNANHFQIFLARLADVSNAPMDVMIFNGVGKDNDEVNEENIKMITINATVYVKENQLKAYDELAQTLIRGTRNERGNLRYDMYQSMERPGEFIFIEQYANQAALDAHHEADHFTTFLKMVEPLLAKEMDVAVFRALPEKE